MRDSAGQQRSPPRLQPFRKTQNACSCSRAHTGESVPRSWCHGAVQRETPGHGPGNFCTRRKSCRGSCDRPPSFLRRPTGGGYHTSVRPRVGWDGTTRSCQGGWNCLLERGRTRNGSIPNSRCRLVVVALETGGRWSEESLQFVESLAGARARDAPHALYHSAALAWRRRWTRMIAVSALVHSQAPWLPFQQQRFSPLEGLTAVLQIWQICLRGHSNNFDF